MRSSTILEIPPQEQDWRLAELRHARRGCVLTLHVLLLCAAGRTPTESAAFLCCSRTRVSRIVHAYHPQWRDTRCDQSLPPVGGLMPSVRRSLRAVLTKAPAVYGRCRPRGSWATLATHLHLQRGRAVSASTLRRWGHALGWGWKRAQLGARDDDPQRVEKLARIRSVLETLGKRAVVRFAEELAIPLLPKGGYQWMPRGTTVKRVTPGQKQKHSLAGALEPRTGRLVQCPSPRKTTALFRALLDRLEGLSPPARFTKVSGVVDNYGLHKAKAVERWLATPPRFELLFLPTSGPQANPSERAFGDVHEKCTRTHPRHRLDDLVGDVAQHFLTNGPWHYHLSQLYYTLEVTAALERLTQHPHLQQAA